MRRRHIGKTAVGTLLGASLLVFLACESSTVPSISGVVTDTRTGKPLESVAVTIVDKSATTDADGRFVLREVPKDAQISAELCGYETASVALDAEDSDAEVDLAMTPLEIPVQVVSNLTNKGMPAVVKAGGGSKKTNKSGVINLHGLCETDKIVASAAGYDKASVKAIEEDVRAILLQAGPSATMNQIVEWRADGEFARAWRFVHPDVREYLTKQEWIKDNRSDLEAGYQVINVTIKDEDYVKWVFPACEYDAFGPKTYKNTATLRAVYHVAQPGGDIRNDASLTHLVQTKDDRWRWFPTPGCRFEPRG